MSGAAGTVEAFAGAKVNLFLHVLGRRADGLHRLDSLAVFPAVGDRLVAEPAEELTLEVRDAPGLSAGPDNLVLRAASGLAALMGARVARPGARLVLHKRLPVASGIGGGSADAAAALRLLPRLWGMRPEDGALTALALSLGADVPVCLHGHAARMGGIGEVVSAPPELPRFGMMLVNPGVGLGTPEVFRARSGPFSAEAALPAGWEGVEAMATDLGRLGNDLQAPAVALCPVLSEVLATLQALPGCLLARMSGSGATCFGLFADAGAAERGAMLVRRDGWWCWGGEGVASVAPDLL